MQYVPHGHYINALVVIIAHRFDKRGKAKNDFYVQDMSSILEGEPTQTRRKTVLSVWRDLNVFKPSPGNIVVVLGAGVNKVYSDDEVGQVLYRKVGGDEHGHLNIYPTNPGKWWIHDLCDDIGQTELERWYWGERMEEEQRTSKEVEEKGLREKLRSTQMTERQLRGVEELDNVIEVASGEGDTIQKGPSAITSTKSKTEQVNMRNDTELLHAEGKVWGNTWWLIDGWY
ncbi:hypothetical protein EDC01DRAFT_49330 [Geopyxis carbonaria]|nr:hypothetical protein EDC01DRAFT_49330 [Geopyxis carbonaria]